MRGCVFTLSSAPKTGATHFYTANGVVLDTLSSAPKTGTTHLVMLQRIADIARIHVPLPQIQAPPFVAAGCSTISADS